MIFLARAHGICMVHAMISYSSVSENVAVGTKMITVQYAPLAVDPVGTVCGLLCVKLCYVKLGHLVCLALSTWYSTVRGIKFLVPSALHSAPAATMVSLPQPY